MSTNYMAFRESPGKPGNLITPKCRMVWPHLFKPTVAKGSEDSAKAKYQLTLLVPKGVDLAPLQKLIESARVAKFGAAPTPKLKINVSMTKEQERLQDYVEDFPYFLRCSSNDAPQVVFSTRDPQTGKLALVEDESEVYGGRWCVASINAYGWFHPTGGKGVSLGLNNVQVHGHDEPIAANRVAASNEFEEVADESGGAVNSSDSLFGGMR